MGDVLWNTKLLLLSNFPLPLKKLCLTQIPLQAAIQVAASPEKANLGKEKEKIMA